jgi:hypothetical protein
MRAEIRSWTCGSEVDGGAAVDMPGILPQARSVDGRGAGAPSSRGGASPGKWCDGVPYTFLWHVDQLHPVPA